MTILIHDLNKTSGMEDELEQIRAKRMEEIKQRIMVSQSGHAGIITINQENYDRIVREHPNLVIDFWAPWCGPCRMLAPVIEELAKIFSQKIWFAKCNTDENQQIAYQYGISAIPSLFFYKNGAVIHTLSGAVPKEQLESVIRSLHGFS